MRTIKIHLKSFDLYRLRKALMAIKEKLGNHSLKIQSPSSVSNSLTRESFSLSTAQKSFSNWEKTYKKKYTVIRSPHVHKKSREQFQFIEHHAILLLKNQEKINPFLFLFRTCSFFGIQAKMSVISHTYLQRLSKR